MTHRSVVPSPWDKHDDHCIGRCDYCKQRQMTVRRLPDPFWLRNHGELIEVWSCETCYRQKLDDLHR